MQSLQITDTHHRWPARLVFSPPPPPRIMASGGPSSSSSSSSAPLSFDSTCVRQMEACLGQWQLDKEPAYPPPGCWIGGHVGLVIEGTIALGEREREGVATQHPLQLGMVRCSLGGLSSDLNLYGFSFFFFLMEGIQQAKKPEINNVGYRIKITSKEESASVFPPGCVHLVRIIMYY